MEVNREGRYFSILGRALKDEGGGVATLERPWYSGEVSQERKLRSGC